MRGALLHRTSGAIRLTSANTGDVAFERKFGPEGSTTIAWYKTALERCKGVARIEKAGKGVGTGWLVRAGDFLPDLPQEQLLLMTNAHVLATPPIREKIIVNPPLLAGEARANFQSCGDRGTVVGIKDVIWCSPAAELDASLAVLDAVPPDARSIPLSAARVAMKDPAPRMYVIGHPGGRDVEISLYDNRLIACNATRLHYRTPTEGGSSGSPVFEQDEWGAVGLHHVGKTTMAALDGSQNTYSANEGLVLSAIQEASRKSRSSSA